MKVSLDLPLDELVSRIADAVVERLRSSELVDARGAASLGVSRALFRRLIKSGQLRGHRSGRSFVVRRADILAYLEAQVVEARPDDAKRLDLDPVERGLASGRLRIMRGGRR